MGRDRVKHQKLGVTVKHTEHYYASMYATKAQCVFDIYKWKFTSVFVLYQGVYLVVEDQRHRHALRRAELSLSPFAFLEVLRPRHRTAPITLLPISFLSKASLFPHVPGSRLPPLSMPNTRRA